MKIHDDCCRKDFPNVYRCYEEESATDNERKEKRLMGADIWMFIEHKNYATNK